MGRRSWATTLVSALSCCFRGGAASTEYSEAYPESLATYFTVGYSSTSSEGCRTDWFADGYCDDYNNDVACEYDGGDCCECDCVDTDEWQCGENGFRCIDPGISGIYGCNVPPAFPPCPRGAQQTWVVEAPAQARAMAANISCSGGSFEVYWRGSVALEDPIYVVNGTVLTVIGADDASDVIDGNGNTRLFTVDNATLHVSNVTISSGVSTVGGAVAATGATLTFSGTRFLNNSAERDGGALWLSDSTASMSGHTEFVENFANSGGAIVILDGSAVSWTGDTKFTSNTALGDGGAVWSVALLESSRQSSTLSINGSTAFLNNTSGDNGGALALLGSLSVEIDASNVSFVGNSAGAAGGAVYVSQTATGPTFSSVSFVSNYAEVGGAVSVVGSGYARDADTDELQETTFERCSFIDNQAETRGGAIASAAGGDRFVDSTFKGNKGGAGGALRLAGTAYLESCLFKDNVSSEGEGAALSNVGTISAMVNTNFSGNVFDCQPDMFLNYSSGDAYGAACNGCQAVCDDCVEPPLVPQCTDVMLNTASEGGPITLEMVSIDKGYWRATNSSREVLACFNADACVGGLTGTADYCLEGYEGPYCAVCGEGYTAQLGFTCRDCSDSAGGLVVAAFLGVAAIFVAVVVVLYVVSGEVGDKGDRFVARLKRYIPLQSVKIVIVAWQILTQFTSVVNVTYPDVYQRFLNIADVVNLDLTWLLSTGCVLDVDFHDRLLLSTICPLIALLFLGGTYSAAARINRGSPQVLQVIWNKHVSVVLLLTFLVYSSVSSVVFQTFACEELDDDRIYLRADYRIECDSPRHKGFQAYAGIMAVLYAAGIPAFYIALLFRDRDVLKLDRVGREDPARVTSTSQLWKHYKPSAFYYEVIECVRRISLTGLVVFVYPNTAPQIAITLMLTFVFAVLSEAFAPYASRWDAWTSRMSHAVIFMSVYVALLLKVDVSDEQGSSQRVFEAVLVAAHVCMVLSIVAETVVIAYSLKVEELDTPACKIRPVDYEDNPFASHLQEVERP